MGGKRGTTRPRSVPRSARLDRVARACGHDSRCDAGPVTGIVEHADDRPSTRRHPLLTVTRVLLLLLWVGWAVLSWWSAPRPATVAQLRADVAAGRITGFTRAGVWESDQRLWASTTTRAESTERGLLIVWHTSSGRLRYVEADGDRHANPPVLHGG